MKKLLHMLLLISLAVFPLVSTVPVEAKQKNTSQKSYKSVKVKAKKKTLKAKKVQVKPRYARNINKPHEGELLKLEGMVKDINEQ
ncbi:MAG: hypothetical protein D6674_05930 [Acidobacteria bacterium]|jgi:hypothetical protein|nr:MAG: hypothetical protein D6674_05930 [Acidobacteriota bacterium]